MKLLLLLTLVWAHPCAFAVVETDGKCSVSDADRNLIARSTVRLNLVDKEGGSHTCSGVITGLSEITTAGHCFKLLEMDLEKSSVFYPGPDGQPEEIKIADMRAQFDSNLETSGADLALVSLKGRTGFKQSIPMAISGCDDDKTYISGYGLQEGDRLPNESRIACYQGTQSANLFLKDGNGEKVPLAQGTSPLLMKQKKNAVCGGDSGGPVFCHSKGRLALIGIHTGITSPIAMPKPGAAGCTTQSSSLSTRLPESLSLIQRWRAELENSTHSAGTGGVSH